MSRLVVAASALLAFSGAAGAESLLIRNATVHTLAAAGTLEGADVLIQNGKIAAVGKGVSAPADATVIDASGRVVTPGLFGGLTNLGLEEIGLEPTSEDSAQTLGTMRPEFDVAPAFNPDSTEIGVNRLEGVTFAVIVPTTDAGDDGSPGSTIIAGQGEAITMDGTILPRTNALFVEMGADGNELSGGSRAAQFMLLQAALQEAREPHMLLPDDVRLLTPAGRKALMDLIRGNRPFVIDVDRASDIRQVLAFAAREKIHVVLSGATEAWRVADALAAAKVPVLIDALEDLPYTFDDVGATMENAARLNKGGVSVAFTLGTPEPQNVRKVRQLAGNAVARGMPWPAALAGITRVPAEIFGVADQLGTLEVGRRADLVVWSGDPLEITNHAERVYIGGVLQPSRSRQTELAERYKERVLKNEAR